MPSIIPGYEYDIFISYRQKDNQYDGWVTEFVENLKKELAATFKEEVSIYFDINPQDGIQETYNVEKTLENKLKSLIFIPIISQTYCDIKSFAWIYEFCAFNKIAKEGQAGRDIKLNNGNVISRILPIKIHDLDEMDRRLLEKELGGVLRSIDFIFKSPGVNRPLRSNEDRPAENLNKTFYRDQMNKVANTIKALITGMQHGNKVPELIRDINQKKSSPFIKKILPGIGVLTFFAVAIFSYLHLSGREKKPISDFEKTIAVLPFVDLSPQHDKEYFTDGMLEEILNNLYKIGDLKVTSRTSSMQYKGETKKSIREIASELGVANILEGSVRLYKNTVRITVQLIRAETDEHLWSEDYDRDFSDIFFIQTEVAEEVAKALKAEISPEVHRLIDLKPSTNPEAYNLYLQAENMDFFNVNERVRQVELLQKAIELDPNFSLAYSAMGLTLTADLTYLSSSKSVDLQETWKKAKPYFIKSLELNPDNGEGHYLFAWSLLWFEWDFNAAYKEYQEAKRIFPNYSWTDFHLAVGEFEEGYIGALKDINFDSKNANSWTGIITSSYFANHNPETEIKKALTTPSIRDNAEVRSESARVYMYLKDFDEALALINQVLKDFPAIESPRLEAVQAISYFKTNRPEETRKIIAKLTKRSETNVGGSPSFYLGMIYSQMGEIDTAFKWLEKSFHDHEIEMYWLKVEPPFEPLRGDHRFQEMLDKVGFSK